MNDTELKLILSKATKAELIETVMKMRLSWRSYRPLPQLIFESRLKVVNDKIDENLKKGAVLQKKLSSLPESEKTFSNPDTLKIMIDIKNNHEEWKRLQAEYDKVEKLAFSEY